MSNKPKYKIDRIARQVWTGNRWICNASSLSMARKIARALNAMEEKPKAKPFEFDWKGISRKYKFAAMDLDGEWKAFKLMPSHRNISAWYPDEKDDGCILGYGLARYPGDWRESLQKRP